MHGLRQCLDHQGIGITNVWIMEVALYILVTAIFGQMLWMASMSVQRRSKMIHVFLLTEHLQAVGDLCTQSHVDCLASLL